MTPEWGVLIGMVIGVTLCVPWIIRTRRQNDPTHDTRGWTSVDLHGITSLNHLTEMRDWLDEHCYVRPENAAAPYKKSDEWVFRGMHRVDIRDPDVAFHFKMRWGGVNPNAVL